ncbi:hypothetical protein BY996DRAFT_6493296 [Phakopsora pachyrhizi]|nr:hypothetical protein BY996DRAFT_6493296 [Phakopsora pachyrhizi]
MESYPNLTYLQKAPQSPNTPGTQVTPVKTLEDIFERSISQKPSCNKYPYLLHTNDTPPPLEKKPQVEFHFSLLPKNQDLNQTPQDNKRNFQEAFENAESRPRKLSNIDREHYFSPQISSDHGDFASERDSFSTYTMKSHSSYVENDYASALKDSEHSYYNRFLRDKYISEYNHGTSKPRRIPTSHLHQRPKLTWLETALMP